MSITQDHRGATPEVPRPPHQPAPGADVRADNGVEVLRRMFDEGFATGQTGIVDELCSPDLVDHQFGLAGVGREAIEHAKAAIVDVHTAVPDIAFTIEDSATIDHPTGATCWVRVHATGTASGPFFGPPSNRKVDFCVIDVARIIEGRIVEHWGVPDRFAMLAQTGVLDRLNPAAG